MTKPAVASPVQAHAAPFRLDEVRLLGGPFKEAQETDRKYLLALEPDRMLSNMRRVSGLAPKGAPYGGWDKDGSGSSGHYLSALALMSAATGDAELKKRMGYVVSEMAACQQANGDGAIYTHAYDKDVFFKKLAQGELAKANVSGWYITHKVMAGLRDAWFLGGSLEARDALLKMCDWAVQVSARVPDAAWQEMMTMGISEFGAPHEVLADVYQATGERKYLELAKRFRQPDVFEPLARGDFSPVERAHANAAIVKFMGYERIYEMTGERAWHDAALNFEREVVRNHSWSNGGNSQWEHFFPRSEHAAKVREVCGPETCNTYNTLKLSQQLWALDLQASRADFIERALFNSILPSQDPEGEAGFGGGFVYYAPQRPGHYRVFSTPFDSFWCCVGTGMENHAKYGSYIYARGQDRLFVNLFAASRASWREKGLTLTQATEFPRAGRTNLALSLARPQRLTLSIRYPSWVVPGALKIRINGRAQKVTARPSTYVDIARTWKDGDKIEVEMPMAVRAEFLPGSDSYVSFLHGPILLAGKMGADGLTKADLFNSNQTAHKSLPALNFPLFMKGGAASPTAQVLASHAAPIAAQPGHFTLRGTTGGAGNPTLVPLFEVFRERYTTYFPILSREEYAREKSQIALSSPALIARALDAVKIGDEASERAHNLRSEGSNSGGEGDKWRDASGFFSYDVKVSKAEPTAIVARYWGGDAGREFDVAVDGTRVATVRLANNRPSEPYFEAYRLPLELTRGKEKVTVRFQPRAGSVAGGVWGLSTLPATALPTK